MTSFRTAIPAFQVANPLYVGATVFFREVDEDGNKTQTLAPLFANAIGSQTVANPQTLDSDGKFVRPVYIDRAVIAEIIGPTVGGHDTGIFRAAMNGKWRDAWQTDTLYEGNEFILDPATLSIYVALETYTSGSAIGDDISAGKLALVIDIGALDDDLPVIVANLSEIQTVAADIDDVITVASVAGDITTIIANLGAIGTVAEDIEDVNIVAENIGALSDVQAALEAGGFGTAAYADIGTGPDQVPTSSMVPGLITITQSDTRQTVSAGPVDSDGRADFLQAGTGLEVVSKDVGGSDPLHLTWGDGFSNGSKRDLATAIDESFAFTALPDDSTVYLTATLDDGSVTFGHTTLAPVYSAAKPSSPATGQIWYPTDHRSRAEVWDGSTWAPTLVLVLGEATTDSGSVVDVRSYAYQGKYRSNVFSITVDTQYKLTTNIGATTLSFSVFARGSSDANWVLMSGGHTQQVSTTGARNRAGLAAGSQKNEIWIGTALSALLAAGNSYAVNENRAGGFTGTVNITTAECIVVAERGW